MLNDQKCFSDKSGLGFDKFVDSSSPVASTARTIFVKLELSESRVTCLDKGNNASFNDHVKIEPKIHVKMQSKPKFIPTCYHCGIIGHTRPHCLQIHSQRPWAKKNDPKKGRAGVEPSQRSVPTCHHCGKIGHTQSSCFKLKPREHKNDNSYYKKSYERLCNMMTNVLTGLDKLDNSHNIAPSVKMAWVRKVDIIHPLRGKW